jgi:hypothetical protein
LAESSETIVGLEQSRDLYKLDATLANKHIDEYDKVSRQTYKLLISWNNFKLNTR